MGRSMRGLLWLLVMLLPAFFACSPVHQPQAPVVPISLFFCHAVAVPPFAWRAPEDTVYMESERGKDRDEQSHATFTGMDLAKRMAVCLKEAGVDATAISVAAGASLQDQVAALSEQGFSCVLLGRVERYEERIGSDWSVNRPASVAFKVLLMETATGHVVWKGSFDEAQQPLSENLLTLKRFVKRKARWVTAGALAENGFKSLVASMVRVGARPRSVGEPVQDQ